ncbi:uncharacterized protein LOC119588781 [Penaeus monodon]|uniref:uncharacterized protein LOC119588781 n=1 Tax=Penaeus monodon TaxID=6687 RepID=UPI0018A7C9A4|nr:uncharacterized protein LOC119588781 [Penaeus monodon]
MVGGRGRASWRPAVLLVALLYITFDLIYGNYDVTRMERNDDVTRMEKDDDVTRLEGDDDVTRLGRVDDVIPRGVAIPSRRLLPQRAGRSQNLGLRETSSQDLKLLHEGRLEAEDPRVITWIREEHLYQPSPLPYYLEIGKNVDFTKLEYWQRVHKGIMRMVNGKRGGFFLEAGALDGYYQSNTFFLERDLGWTGLLVEPNPVFFEALLARHRRAWATDLCLGTKPYAYKTEFWVHTGPDPEQSLIAASRSGLLKEHLEHYKKGGLESGSVVEVNLRAGHQRPLRPQRDPDRPVFPRRRERRSGRLAVVSVRQGARRGAGGGALDVGRARG